MEKLTMGQAIVISGYTGIMACPFSKLHDDAEKRLGRPVYTHEFAGKAFTDAVKELYRDEFLAMIPESKEGE